MKEMTNTTIELLLLFGRVNPSCVSMEFQAHGHHNCSEAILTGKDGRKGRRCSSWPVFPFGVDPTLQWSHGRDELGEVDCDRYALVGRAHTDRCRCGALSDHP